MMLNFKKVSIFAFALLAVLALSVSSFTLPSAEEKAKSNVEYGYYYVAGTCHCDIDGSGEKLHSFVSGIRSGERNDRYEYLNSFVDVLKRDYDKYYYIENRDVWFYDSEDEAVDARRRRIREHEGANYQIHYVRF